MMDPVLRAAELHGLAGAAEASRDAAILAEVRAKHERARIAWNTLAEGQEAIHARRLATALIVRLREEQTCGPSDGPQAQTTKTQAKIVERWRYLRALLIQQLDAFAVGGLRIHSDDVNVSSAAMARLGKSIAEFDVLIAEDEARWAGDSATAPPAPQAAAERSFDPA